jgi:flagellar protein FlaJ
LDLSKIRERIKKAYRSFHRLIERNQSSKTKLHVVAYQLIGERIASLLPLFEDMRMNYRKAGIMISFKAYVSFVILTFMIVSMSFLILIPSILFFVLHLSLLSSLLFGIGGSLFAGALTIILFYVYPAYRADSLKRNLDEELPFTTGYMAILSGAGVPPDMIFRSLAEINSSLAISNEAKKIVRDVELFGYDILSALEAASERTPSVTFKELLEGFIATVHSGGGLTKYLRDRSRQYMKLKRIALRRFSDTLSILAEFYVALLVAGPLILVVMLAVMAMLGGGTELLNPRLLLYLLTYLGIPIGSIVFLIMLDVISPRR